VAGGVELGASDETHLDALDGLESLDGPDGGEERTPVEAAGAVEGQPGAGDALGGVEELEGLEGLDLDGGVTVSGDELDTLTAPLARAAEGHSRALLAYTALGAGFGVLGRGLSLRLEDALTADSIGALVLAAVIGAFTTLGIGLADQTGLRLGWRRAMYTTVSGAVLGTLGSFCLFVPMFTVRSTFLRLAVYSAAIAGVDAGSQRGTAGAGLSALAGLAAGWLTSVAPWIDPYSPAPLAMGATFGLLGLSLGMARRVAVSRA